MVRIYGEGDRHVIVGGVADVDRRVLEGTALAAGRFEIDIECNEGVEFVIGVESDGLRVFVRFDASLGRNVWAMDLAPLSVAGLPEGWSAAFTRHVVPRSCVLWVDCPVGTPVTWQVF